MCISIYTHVVSEALVPQNSNSPLSDCMCVIWASLASILSDRPDPPLIPEFLTIMLCINSHIHRWHRDSRHMTCCSIKASQLIHPEPNRQAITRRTLSSATAQNLSSFYLQLCYKVLYSSSPRFIISGVRSDLSSMKWGTPLWHVCCWEELLAYCFSFSLVLIAVPLDESVGLLSVCDPWCRICQQILQRPFLYCAHLATIHPVFSMSTSGTDIRFCTDVVPMM